MLVGVGTLRVRGLLLAISTLAFAIAAQVYLFNRPFFTAGSTTVEIPRTDIGPLELTHRNRAYYYFVLVHARRRAGARRRTSSAPASAA